jgi:hypothetical protein
MADYRKKDAGGPCQILVAPGLGFLGQGQSCVRSCSPEGSLGMTPVQQDDEITPLVRRVVDPREGSLYPPRRFGWDSSKMIFQPIWSSSTGSPAPVASSARDSPVWGPALRRGPWGWRRSNRMTKLLRLCVGSLTLVKEAFIRRGVSVGILLRWFSSRFGLPPRVRQLLLHTKTPPYLPLRTRHSHTDRS